MTDLDFYNSICKFCLDFNAKHRNTEILQHTSLEKEFTHYGSTLAQDLQWWDLNNHFDEKKAQKIYNALLSSVEVARTLSHKRVYYSVQENDGIPEDDFVLVVEDSNIYTDDFKIRLGNVIKQLKDPKYKYVELVILSYFTENNIVDYIAPLTTYINAQVDYKIPPHYIPHSDTTIINNYDKRNPNCEKLYTKESQNALDRIADREKCLKIVNNLVTNNGINADLLNEVIDYHMDRYIGFNPKFIVTTECTEITNDINSSLYNKNISLFPVNFIRPCINASSCYLIKKKACRRITNNYKKPFWYATDFKQIIPVQNILFVSPILCTQPKDIYKYPIDRFTWINKYFGKKETVNDIYRFKVLRYLPFIQEWHLSPNPRLQKASRLLQSILRIKRVKYQTN